MTLSADHFARAVMIAPQIEKAPIDVIAGHIFRDFAAQENATGEQIEKALEIWLTAFNMSRAAIVRNEWSRAGTDPSAMIGRILDRINLVDGGTSPIVENNEPLPLKRLTDLERRVEALEKVHPADRQPKKWVTVQQFQADYGVSEYRIVLVTEGVGQQRIGDDDFKTRGEARTIAMNYADNQGFEYRD